MSQQSSADKRSRIAVVETFATSIYFCKTSTVCVLENSKINEDFSRAFVMGKERVMTLLSSFISTSVTNSACREI